MKRVRDMPILCGGRGQITISLYFSIILPWLFLRCFFMSCSCGQKCIDEWRIIKKKTDRLLRTTLAINHSPPQTLHKAVQRLPYTFQEIFRYAIQARMCNKIKKKNVWYRVVYVIRDEANNCESCTIFDNWRLSKRF